MAQLPVPGASRPVAAGAVWVGALAVAGAVALALALAVTLAAAAAPGLLPAAGIILPPCPFKALTGLTCPGCGSVRAVQQLLHGDLMAALDLNPLAVVLLPLVAWQLAAIVSSRLRGRLIPGRPRGRLDGRPLRSLWGPLEARWSAGAVLVAVAAFWVLRNIGCFPFTVLAP